MNIHRTSRSYLAHTSLTALCLSSFGLAFACSPAPSPIPGGSSGGAGSTTASGGNATSSGSSSGNGGAGPSTGSVTGAGGSVNPGAGGSVNPGAGGAGEVGGGNGTGGVGDVGGSAGTGGGSTTGGADGTGGGPPVVVERPPLITSSQGSACAPTLAGCSYWKTDGAVTDSTANADVTVSSNGKQIFTGFGGSFNEEGWQNLLKLTPAEQAQALSLLFDAKNGANFVYGRIPIGASDYAIAPRYSLQESASAAFSIERDKNLLIPFIKAAQQASKNITFWGSPWSPPPWMKSNNGYDGGNMKTDATTFQAFAEYLANFVKAYGAEGIPISAIHPQNEPGFTQSYPSCSWDGAGMADFIGNYLGPEFTKQNITAKIFIGTMSNSQTDGAVMQTVMNNAKAKGYIKGYGLQWGMQSAASGLDNKAYEVWQTEHKCGNYPFGGQSLASGIPGSIPAYNSSKAPNDHAYAEEGWGLIREWIKGGVTSYSAWNMVLDTVGLGEIDTARKWNQNALITVDLSAKTLNLTPTYFVFRHVSQYVDPGAQRLDTSGGDALAFKNKDGSITTVIYNNGSAKDLTVSVNGKKLKFAMPSRGWATLNVKP